MRKAVGKMIATREEADSETDFWLRFAPMLKAHPVEVDHPRQVGTRIELPAWTFLLDGQTFAIFPTLEHRGWMALSSTEEADRVLSRRAQEVLNDWHFKEKTLPDVETLGNFAEVHLLHTDISVPGTVPRFHIQPPVFAGEVSPTVATGRKEIYKIGENLTDLYPEQLRRAHRREPTAEELHRGLFGERPRPHVLLGRKDSGRHTLLEHALRLEMDRRPGNELPGTWLLDPNRIVAGMSELGAWENRLGNILRFLIAPESKQISLLVFDKPEALLSAVGGSVTMAHFLLPYLRKKQLRLVLVSTPDEWRMLRERIPELVEYFKILPLHEPDRHEALAMAMERRNELELRYEVRLRAPVLTEIDRLHRLFTPGHALPGALTRPLESLAAGPPNREVSPDDCRVYFREQTGLSGQLVQHDADLGNEEVETYLNRRVIGQEEALRALADTLYLARTRLLRPGRPVASFLLLGATGVGKTESVRALTEYLTGDPEDMVRINMNEFTNPWQVQQLIGTPDHPDGILTDAVRARPSGVLLLDEIEKAHSNIYHLLLQVLDAARLTDGRGRTVRFDDYIIVMTSNLGAEQVDALLKLRDNEQERRAVYRRVIGQAMPPEFVNRIDRTIYFNRLQPEHLMSIAKLQIERLLNREGFLRRTTLLKVSEAALHWVATRGYDPKMGGRALKRQIERDLTVVSAEKITGLHAAQPVILELDLKNDALNVQLIPLEPVATNIPLVLTRKVGSRDFRAAINRLLGRAETLRDRVDRHLDRLDIDLTDPEQQQAHWLRFHFRDRAHIVVEDMRRLHLRSQHDLKQQANGVPPLRIRRIESRIRRWESNKERDRMRDLLFQREVRDRVMNELTLTEPDYSVLHSLYLQHYLQLRLLEHALPHFLADRAETTYLQVVPETSVPGRNYPRLMLQQYREALQLAGIFVESTEDEDGAVRIQGYGIADLLAGETGIHLFQPDQRPAIPLRLSISTASSGRESGYRLVRYYSADRLVIDPRTDLKLSYPIDPNSLILLIWAGAK